MAVVEITGNDILAALDLVADNYTEGSDALKVFKELLKEAETTA